MRLTSVLATVFVAVVLQAAFSRYTVGGTITFDLVLVGVAYAALQWGAAAGMVAGTLGGLIQDLLGGGIIGVGGLAKTLVGYLAGTVGAQFVLARPHVRTAIVAVASLLHRIVVLLLVAVIDQRWSGLPWVAMLIETGINAGAAFIAFQVTDALPGVVERGRASRRSGFSRRQW
ncbi:MAG: rod shape-determining protein MreD [Vicinamibacterales bacterium]